MLFARVAWAGPPFITDDPDPVAFQHWEVYIASIGSYNRMLGLLSTLPHLEVNYGAAPGLQLHLIAPMTAARVPSGPLHYGFGDTELGFKLRLLPEGKHSPEVGIFPLVEAPTGNAALGLGAGFTQIFIPLWLQKSWGGASDSPTWTSYGGAGWWRNPGPGNRNWDYEGWELQRNYGDKWMLGGEIFHEGAATVGGSGGVGFNLGGQVNFSDHRHLLYSAGTDGQSPRAFIWYAAYQWTF